LLLPGVVGAVVAVVVFAAGRLFGSCDADEGEGLLLFCVGVFDFAALFDWEVLPCRG
jgi:hypothetical protein